MTHAYFKVGEIAIIVDCWPERYNNTECTITGGLCERVTVSLRDPLHLPYKTLSYEVSTCDGQKWVVSPPHLRKRYDPGTPWAELRDELNKKPVETPEECEA